MTRVTAGGWSHDGSDILRLARLTPVGTPIAIRGETSAMEDGP
jgi:hypothetical protein